MLLVIQHKQARVTCSTFAAVFADVSKKIRPLFDAKVLPSSYDTCRLAAHPWTRSKQASKEFNKGMEDELAAEHSRHKEQ